MMPRLIINRTWQRVRVREPRVKLHRRRPFLIISSKG